MPIPIMPIPIIGLSTKVRHATADFDVGSRKRGERARQAGDCAFDCGIGLEAHERSAAPADRRGGPIIGIIMPGSVAARRAP